MKTTAYLLLAFTAVLFFISCKKDSPNTPPGLTFTGNVTEGTANAAGEYTLTGHISSAARLDKVVLTKEGQSGPFLTDDTTAKNKTEYDFSYLITGITSNTYIVMDIYDQQGVKVTQRFLIKK
jgi:hypothetical protein